VLDRFLGVAGLRVGLSQELVSLDLLFDVVCLLAQLKKLLAVLHSPIQLTLGLVDHADLLVALSLNDLILGSLSHMQALLKELEGHVEFVVVQVLVSDGLVYAHQVF